MRFPSFYKTKIHHPGDGFYALSDRDRIRTCDRLLRRQMLYPAELRDHDAGRSFFPQYPPKPWHRKRRKLRNPAKYSIILRGKYTNVLFRIKLIASNI